MTALGVLNGNRLTGMTVDAKIRMMNDLYSQHAFRKPSDEPQSSMILTIRADNDEPIFRNKMLQKLQHDK